MLPAMVIRLVRAAWRGLRDPEFRSLLYVVALTLGSGTVFYTLEEEWSVVDSLYFSVITLTTVGYGDLSPSTTRSKVFTVVYIVVGIGILLAFVERIARHATEAGGLGRLLGTRREREQPSRDENDA